MFVENGHIDATDGFISFVGFNPSNKVGLVILCSCDENDITENIDKIGIRYLLGFAK